MKNNFNASPVFEPNYDAYNSGMRVIANKGGTRSGKTFSVLLLLLAVAYHADNDLLISVVSESFPHLKRGAMRDFDSVLQANGFVEGKHYSHSRTEHLYKFRHGGRIEFFSADNAGKVHGAQRDILFINECNHIPYEIYRQLAVRTAHTIFLDWNPTSRFWFDDKVAMKDGVCVIHSTYMDNPFLSAAQVAEIESNRSDANWWKVYGLGETGSHEGLIYTNWDIVDKIPGNYKKRFIGIDFGFTNDPTAIVDIYLSEGELWIDELCYQRGLNNKQIADILKAHNCNRNTDIVCDSAEPKSIAEINAFGLNAQGAKKGPDSIRNGIQLVQRYKLHITKRSVSVINELRNYSWKRDSSGNWLNVPLDLYSHAADAIRYACSNCLQQRPTLHKPKIRLTYIR